MPKNHKLNDLLDKGEIKRGKGFTLSTEGQQEKSALVHLSTDAEVHKSISAPVHKSTDAEVQKSTSAEVLKSTEAQVQKNTSALVHKSTEAQVQNSISAQVHKDTEDIRPSKGYKLRTDVADACKLFAVQHKRKLYDVMEEALIEYLQKHGIDIH